MQQNHKRFKKNVERWPQAYCAVYWSATNRENICRDLLYTRCRIRYNICCSTSKSMKPAKIPNWNT